MNKYIKTDIEQGIQYLKIGIMNALADLESGKEKEIKFEKHLPLYLIIQCAEKRGWKEDMNDWDWTNGWEVDFWYKMIFPDKNIHLNITGSLLYGTSSIYVDKYE